MMHRTVIELETILSRMTFALTFEKKLNLFLPFRRLTMLRYESFSALNNNGQNLKGFITRDEMISSVVEIYKERKNLARTINDSTEHGPI